MGALMVPGIIHKSFRSFDGTRIAYQVRGPEGAPAVVLANGLGGGFEAFRHIYAALGERYRILCWDYRGLFRSERPRDLATLSIPSHCRDLAALLDEERIGGAVVIGWSMGVQVAFELFRHHRRLMRGIVAVNGTYGTPFRSALASRLSRYVIPPLLGVLKTRAALVGRLTHHAVAWDGLVPLLVRAGLASSSIDTQAIREVAEDFKTIDFALYSDQLRALGRHDARDLLSAIDIPVLIITGDKDLMTPVFTARRMNQRISGSRLIVLEGGSHYTPLEFPEEIGREVALFVGAIPGYRRAEAA
jgi:pimeloyl-ACP methyl ester carboxylesterase